MADLKVYHLPGKWGLQSVSPFCLKLDIFFRMTDIEHESIITPTPFGGPNKKAPWIVHDGKKIGDSTLIIDHLKNAYGVDPDAHLSAQQRASAVAIQRLVEENLYWAMVYDRWRRPENWPVLNASVLSGVPQPMRALLGPVARRGLGKQLAGHGMGLHSEAQIAAIANKDIDALAALLGDKDWFLGDAPSMADATVYSVLANIVYVPFASPMKPMIAAHDNLTAWLERFRTRFYPEHKPEQEQKGAPGTAQRAA